MASQMAHRRGFRSQSHGFVDLAATYARWLTGRFRAPATAPDRSPEHHRALILDLAETIRTGPPPFATLKGGPGHQARHVPGLGAATPLDLRELNGILDLDTSRGIVKVEPLVTMRQLLHATLPSGWAPAVVPEFPEITVGGAVQGLAAESTSHRAGLFHESVLAQEVLLGDGRILEVTPSDHDDLWHWLPGTYGTLAVTTRITMALAPVRPWVRLEHRRQPLEAFIREAFDLGADAVDAIALGRDEVVVTTARWADEPEDGARLLRLCGAAPYYCDHVMAAGAHSGPEFLDFAAYAFRFDRGAFWVAPTKLGRSPARRWLFADFATAANLYHLRRDRQRRPGSPSHRVVQDCIVPAERAGDLVAWLRRDLDGPLWLLPISSGQSNPFGLGPGRWMNVGIYLRLPEAAGDPVDFNLRLERLVAELGGVKTLHAQVFCDRDEFEGRYDLAGYDAVRSRYGAERAFPHLADKLGVRGGRPP